MTLKLATQDTSCPQPLSGSYKGESQTLETRSRLAKHVVTKDKAAK